MKSEKNFLFFTAGKVDEALKPNISYSIEVVDAEYSLALNKVQIVYSAFDWESDSIGYLLEEYDPTSTKFNKVVNTAIYVVEGSAIKKVCVGDFIGCAFNAELTFESGVPEINWSTIEPIESCISKLGPVCSGID